MWYVCPRCTEKEKVVVFIQKDDGMVVSPAFLKTPGDILEAALVRERNAHTFYSEALKHAGSGPVRELLEQLRDSEYMHMQSIEKKMAEMQLG